MVVVNEYFRDLMTKILSRYDVIKNLGDSREDFFTLDVELTKINGLLRVLLSQRYEFKLYQLTYQMLNHYKDAQEISSIIVLYVTRYSICDMNKLLKSSIFRKNNY